MDDVPRVYFPALLAAALLTSGCGGADAPPSAADHSGPSPLATSSVTAAPSPSAAPSKEPVQSRGGSADKPSGSGTKMPPTILPVARPDGSRHHLLDAETLPAYSSSEGAWSITATGAEAARPVGACQKASLVDIGALHAVRRSFAGAEASGVRAREVVGRFADAKSAWRAHEVLRTWRAECEDWIDAPRAQVGPIQTVTTSTGNGSHYRAVYGPKRDTDATGLGIVRKGRWLAIVAISTDEELSDTWTRRAVQRIARTFGA